MTLRQQQLLAYIAQYQREHEGVTPSYAEMASAMGIVKSGVFGLLHTLQSLGFIRWTKGRARSIEILRRPELDVCPCCGRAA